MASRVWYTSKRNWFSLFRSTFALPRMIKVSCFSFLIHLKRPYAFLDLAFPPADGAIRNCLARVLDLNGVTKRYLKFFASLFKAARDELRRNKTTFSDSRTLASWWSMNVNDIREELYSRVAEDTEKEITIEVN
jgi:hypothetical protein